MPVIKRFKVNTDSKKSEKIVDQNQLSHNRDQHEFPPKNIPFWKRFWNFIKNILRKN